MTREEMSFLRDAIKFAYERGVSEAQANENADSELRAQEIFDYLFDEAELVPPDDVDETNYDPFAGSELFEADYNLGEPEEW